MSILVPRQNAPIQPQRFSAKLPRVREWPWFKLEKNQALNRLAIETVGFYSWNALFSRSRFELIENGLDWLGWFGIGFLMPITFGKRLRNGFQRKVLERFGETMLPAGKSLAQFFRSQPAKHELSLIEAPFEVLDQAGSLSVHTESANQFAEQLGFKDGAHLKTFFADNPALRALVRKAKVTILGIDITLMAIKGQVYNWGSKWLTAKLSHQRGFSGEFNLASKAHVEQNAAGYEKVKQQKKIASFCIGFIGALGMPLLMRGLLGSGKIKAGVNVLGKLKQVIPAFNYTDAIYMSKYVILWHNFFNFVTPSILSARDKHEMREKINKAIAFDSFYFIGDDIIMGFVAKHLQQKHAAALGEVSLIEPGKRFLKVFPKAKRLSDIYVQSGGNIGSLGYRLGLKVFAAGFLGTMLGLGIASNMANRIYTRKKVEAETHQAAQTSQAVQQAPSRVLQQPMIPYWPGSRVKSSYSWANPYPYGLFRPSYSPGAPSYRLALPKVSQNFQSAFSLVNGAVYPIRQTSYTK